MLLFGPLIAVFGRSWFPYISAVFASAIALLTLLTLCSIFGWMDHKVGIWLCTVISLVVSVVLGWLAYELIYFAVGFVGVVGGFFLGGVCYSVFQATFKWNSLAALITFSVVFAMVGEIVAFKHPRVLVMLATAGLGSYIFMRGLTMCF